MRKSERRLTKKLMLNRKTVRTLARRELTKVAGGLEDSHDTCAAKVLLVDSHDPCTAKMPLAPSAPCRRRQLNDCGPALTSHRARPCIADGCHVVSDRLSVASDCPCRQIRAARHGPQVSTEIRLQIVGAERLAPRKLRACSRARARDRG